MKVLKQTSPKEDINKELSAKSNISLFEAAGLGSVEKALHKIPFIGKGLPFLIINLLAATIFYYLCYGSLWFFSLAPDEEGQWFVRRFDLVGKSNSRLTTFGAEQIAYFVAGFAACLFTYANFSKTSKINYWVKAALIALIPLGLLGIAKSFTALPVYIPMALVYGQFAAIVVACSVKLLGGNKTANCAKS